MDLPEGEIYPTLDTVRISPTVEINLKMTGLIFDLDQVSLLESDCSSFYLLASSIATAHATVIPTMGLLPAPIRPIISTSNPPSVALRGEKASKNNDFSRVSHITWMCS